MNLKKFEFAHGARNLENKRNLIYILVSGFQKETTSFDQNLNTAATT